MVKGVREMLRSNRRRAKIAIGSRLFDGLNVFIVLLIAFITLYPVYYILIVSISDGKYVLQNAVHVYPKGISFAAYKEIIQHKYFMLSYKNTIVYTVVGTAVNMFVSILCAYPLSRKELQGRKVITALIMFTMFFSGGLIPLYLQVINLGIQDTMWALILPVAVSTYNMVVMRSFFANIPAELHESAFLDGANDIQVLIRIILPLSGAMIATMVLFYAVSHWNSYFRALIYLNTREKYPLQLVLRNIVIQGTDMDMLDISGTTGAAATIATLNYKYAAIIVAVVPILSIYPFIQKYFAKGVMIGSLKG